MSGLCKLLGSALSSCHRALKLNTSLLTAVTSTTSCCSLGPLTFSFFFLPSQGCTFSLYCYLIRKTPGSPRLDSYGSGGNSKDSLSTCFMMHPWPVWQVHTRQWGEQTLCHLEVQCCSLQQSQGFTQTVSKCMVKNPFSHIYPTCCRFPKKGSIPRTILRVLAVLCRNFKSKQKAVMWRNHV